MNLSEKRTLTALFVTKIIALYATKKKKKNFREQEKTFNSTFESVGKYLSEFMLNSKVVKFSKITKSS